MAWKRPVKPPRKGPPRIQKWYAEMSKRLGGVPTFVIKDAQKVYSAGIKDPSRQGCTDLGGRMRHEVGEKMGDIRQGSEDGMSAGRGESDGVGDLRERLAADVCTGHGRRAAFPFDADDVLALTLVLGLALAALDHAMCKIGVMRSKPDLLAATAHRVDNEMLIACSRIVCARSRDSLPHETPTLARFVSLMCEELKLRGGWAKAANAVAAQVGFPAPIGSPPGAVLNPDGCGCGHDFRSASA